MTTYGDSPIDAKRTPVTLLMGFVLLMVGILITAYGMYSIVASLIGEIHAFGLIGGLLITPIGILLIIVGGLLFLFGSFGVLFGKRYRRIAY